MLSSLAFANNMICLFLIGTRPSTTPICDWWTRQGWWLGECNLSSFCLSTIHHIHQALSVCLFIFLLFFCLFLLFVQNPSSCVAQHIDHKEESPLADDREYARGVASEGLLCCRAKRRHVLRNTTRWRETTNQPVKCKQIFFCQTWEDP